MNDGFIYSYYDEIGKYIAIVHKKTPQETIDRFKKIYDEVKYEE